MAALSFPHFFVDKGNTLDIIYNMSNIDVFKPLESKRTFEVISEQIKDLVYSGRLKPGDKLPTERELATQFKTGRMVVRESLRMLEQSCFISVKNGYKGGVFVRDVGASAMTDSIADMVKLGKISLQELTETRIEIESIVVELAVQRMDNHDLEQLRMSIERAEKLTKQANALSRDENVMFHVILARGSRNYLLEMIVESVMKAVISILYWLKIDIAKSKKIVEDHRAIYEALCEKDVESAKRLTRGSILYVRDIWAPLFEKALQQRDDDTPVTAEILDLQAAIR
jgi:GntR family transcriptional regulator, transcriptional repressor for pyruvate dehydrogenase complex